jgi:hypothetical protein
MIALLAWRDNEVSARLSLRYPVAAQAAQPSGHGSYSYRVSMGTALLSQNDTSLSPALLYEDGQLLGPGNAMHTEIGTRGQGRFSFWKGDLVFSASDNSDPRMNGRQYTLVLPLKNPFMSWSLVILLTISLIFGFVYSGFYKINVPQKLKTLLPTSPYGKLALFVFLAMSLLITYIGRNERSGWNKIQTPIDRRASLVSLIGWSNLQADAIPLMAEDRPSMHQVIMFSGGQSNMDFRFLRAMMGFVAALFAPFLGIVKGLLLANYISWCAAAWAAWRFTKKVFQDELAALIAVLLVAGGMGFVVHIGDYGAHLMGFTFYYLGILLIYESRVWSERRPLRIHLIVGLFLALASLAYGTSLALTVGYIVVAAWPGRNRWHHLALAAVIAFSARPMWNGYLSFLNSTINGIDLGYSFQALENAYWFQQPWSAWLAILQQHNLLKTLAYNLVQFLLFVDSPLVLAIGLLSFFALPKRPALWWFYVVFFCLPFAAAIWTYSKPIAGLGYLVYGTSLLVYAAFAGAMSRLLSSLNVYRPVGVGLLVIIVVTHFGWSTAHFWNYLGPVKTYFNDFDYSKSLLTSPPAEVLSLTGAEPTPVYFGGNASLQQAGVYIDTSRVLVKPSLGYALLSRALFFLYLAPLVFLAIPKCDMDQTTIHPGRFPRLQSSLISLGKRVSSPMFVGFVTTWILFVMFAMMLQTRPAFTNQWDALRIPAGEKVRYTITLSDPFLDALERQWRANPEAELWFFSQPNHGSCQIEVLIGNQKYLTATLPNRWRGGNRARSSPSEVIAALRTHRQVTLVVTALEETTLAGWQRNGLSGRNLVTTFPGPQPILLAFEIRLRSPGGTGILIFAGF